MYNYGGGSCGCSNMGYAPYYQYGPQSQGCGCGGGSNYAIVLVLFILLVIVIGSRWAN